MAPDVVTGLLWWILYCDITDYDVVRFVLRNNKKKKKVTSEVSSYFSDGIHQQGTFVE